MNFGKLKVAQLPSAADLVSAQMEVYDAFEAMTATGVECEELTTIVENLSLATASIKAYGGKGVEIFNTDGSLESILGVDILKSANKVTAALEGRFTDAMKNLWRKIREWFARLYDWFRKMFFSLEGDLKHLEGMVAASNDKNFNPDAEVSFPIPTKLAIDTCLRSASLGLESSEKIYTEISKGLEDMSKIDISKLNDASGQEIQKVLEPLEKRLDSINEETKKKYAADPIFAKMVKAAGEVDSAAKGNGGLIAALVSINQNFIRSGKVSDLGFKSGADIRESVTELAKIIRASEKQAPLANKMLQSIDALIKKLDSAAESLKLGDFSKLAHGYMRALIWVNNQTTRLDRWIIMGVTRAVRQMYK